MERGRYMGRRSRSITTKRAECSELGIDSTAAILIQPTLRGALRAAEIARIDAIAIRGVAGSNLIHDMALREERPAIPNATSRGADLDVHGLLSLDGAAPAAGQRGGHDRGALEVAFRALEHELLSALLGFHAESLLAAAELLPHRALAESR